MALWRTRVALGAAAMGVLVSACSPSTNTPAVGPTASGATPGANVTSSPAASTPNAGTAAGAPLPVNLQGTWTVDSSTFYYDAGGSGSFSGGLYSLTMSGARWSYGSSSGTAAVAPITAADWSRWNIAAYGPAERLILSGWNGGSADGPIETETSGTVDFVWVIYKVSSPEPGSVWLKFGH